MPVIKNALTPINHRAGGCTPKWIVVHYFGALVSLALIIACAAGADLTEITLAVIAEATASSGFYLWKAKNENRAKYAQKYMDKWAEKYGPEAAARIAEIVLKD